MTIRNKPEVIDPPQNKDMTDIVECVNSPAKTALKPNVTVSSSVHKLLECPVCLNAMYPPIHQCSNGHTLCSSCKPRVHDRCPICRHELGNIRCLALEKVAASLELPCIYQSFGCIGIYPYHSKSKHESQCVFRPYSCPYSGSECTAIGDIPYLVAHLKDDHKVDMHNGSTFNHRYVKSNPHEVENATWMLTVFSCFGQYFCLHFEAFHLGQNLTSTTTTSAAEPSSPSSIDPLFHLLTLLPYSILRPPRLRLKLPSFTLPSSMTVFSLVLLTYFMVVSGIVYDVIVEPPGIGSTQDPYTGSVKPVVFLPGRVNGQYIIEGLSSGFMFVVGGVGIILMDLALEKNRAKSVKVSYATAGISSVVIAYVMSMLFLRIKIPGYLR